MSTKIVRKFIPSVRLIEARDGTKLLTGVSIFEWYEMAGGVALCGSQDGL